VKRPAPVSVDLMPTPGLQEVLADRTLLDRLATSVLLDLRRQVRHLDADLDAALYLRTTAALEHHEPERLMSVPDAAPRLGLTAPRLYELIRQGRFPSVEIGKYKRVRESDIQSFMKTGEPTAVDSKIYDPYS